MWKKKNSLFNRTVSGAMGIIMTAISAFSPLTTLPVYAGESLIDMDYRQVKSDKVEIHVQSEGMSFEPGSEVQMKVFVQNNTEKTLVKGGLSWRDENDVLENKRFVLWEDELEEAELAEEVTEDETAVSAVNAKGTVTNITLEPGEVYEVGFRATVDESLELFSRKEISFFFGAYDAEYPDDVDKVETRTVDFAFTAGLVSLLPAEHGDENHEVEAGSTGSMALELVLDTSEYSYEMTKEELTTETATDSNGEEEPETATDSNSEEEPETATDSNGEEEPETATDSNGEEEPETATDSNSEEEPETATDSSSKEDEGDEEEDDYLLELQKIKYDIAIYNVKFDEFEIVDAELNEGGNSVTAYIEYEVDENTTLGTYFGRIDAVVELDGKNFYATQGFDVTVVEAEPTLTAEQLAEVQNVIDMIAKLPSWEEHSAKVAEFEDVEDYEGLEEYLIGLKRMVLNAYNAYEDLNEDQKNMIPDEDSLWLNDLYGMLSNIPIIDNSIIKEELDGDYAFISSLKIQEGSFVTGTAPFDENDAAGNDSKGKNSVLRTFDTATYTVEFTTGLREEVKEQSISGYKTGRVFFEIILPKNANEAVFEKGSMLWLNSAPDIHVEQVTETVNNKTLQILRGSYKLIASDKDNAAIGASVNEFAIAIRALRMLNGDKVQPEVSLWLEYNDVGVELKNGVVPKDIVSSKYSEVSEKHECNVDGHGCEYKELSLPEITISAAPRFNVVLEPSTSTQNTVVGKYNMSTTNPAALNRDLGEVEGRLSAVGVLIEVRGKDGHGLRGVEFPSEEKPITFTINLSSYFKRANGTTDTGKSAKYPLLFFSGGGNSSANSDNADKREVDAYKNYVLTVPFNKGRNHHACENGGTWKFSDVAGDRGKVNVTVSDFDFDISHFPYGYSDGTDKNYKYYNPNTINNWWEIEEAVFSSGEVWVLQPYYSLDNNKQYVVDAFNSEGQFHYNLAISDFEMWDESGDRVTTQANPTDRNDDQCEFTQALKNPGSADGLIGYLKYNYKQWDDALTEGSMNVDNDWAVAGEKIAIRAHTVFTGGTEQYAAVAVDQLIKFDDEFFEPERCNIGNINYFKEAGRQTIIYWAAKPNGDGWDSDDEMKKATIDDLVFYEDLDDLKADGKIPVGVLDERRGVQAEGSHNTMIFILGKIKEDCPTNKVYMTVRNSYVWRKTAVWEAAANYFKTNKQSLSDAQYCKYMKDVFPSQANSEKPLMMDDNGIFNKSYPAPSWRHDYHFTNGRGKKLSENEYVEIEDTGGCKTAAKATYDADGWHAGTGVIYYQDSCLVVPYETSIEKSSAQTERDIDTGKSIPKKVYDMNQGQRTIDYVLYPKVDRKLGQGSSSAGTLSTIVYVEDVLPKELTYINGSAYLGGDYNENATGIKVTGGINENANANTNLAMYFKQEEFKKNSDGTTSIRWSFPVTLDTNTSYWTEPIYFSCTIGTPGDESTDVKNADEINNTVKIWSDGEAKRAFSLSNGNLSQYGIHIQKTGAYSIAKLADQLVVDAWADMGYTMNIGNNSDKAVSNMVIVESLPYNGIGESSFHGKLQVSEFSAGAVDTVEHSKTLVNGFKFYYTTNSKYKGCTGSDLESVNFATNSDWKALKLSTTVNNVNGRPKGLFTTSDGKTFPGSVTDQIIAIVAVGTLPKADTLKMHVSLRLPDGEANDTLLNKLYVGAVESEAKVRVVSRNLEGLVWYDTNLDGEQNETSDKNMSGVIVSLWKADAKGVYQPYYYPGTTKQIVVETGYEISAQAVDSSAATVYKPNGEEGHYRFTELPAGTYAVRFDYGVNKLDSYVASPANNIINDEKDSDGIPMKNNTDLYSEVNGIVMKDAKEITQGTGEVKNVDSGFGRVGSITIKKLVDGNLGDREKDFGFKFSVNGGKYTDYAVTSADGVKIDKVDGSFTLSHNESVVVANIPLEADVIVSEDNDDYEASIKVNNVEKDDEDSSDSSAKVTLSGFVDGTAIVFTNKKEATIDTGILLDSAPYIATLAIALGGMAIYVISKRKKEEDDME